MNQLIFGYRELDCLFNLLANEKVLNFHKSEETHKLIG